MPIDLYGPLGSIHGKRAVKLTSERPLQKPLHRCAKKGRVLVPQQVMRRACYVNKHFCGTATRSPRDPEYLSRHGGVEVAPMTSVGTAT
jgi:hypothetical protein